MRFQAEKIHLLHSALSLTPIQLTRHSAAIPDHQGAAVWTYVLNEGHASTRRVRLSPDCPWLSFRLCDATMENRMARFRVFGYTTYAGNCPLIGSISMAEEKMAMGIVDSLSVGTGHSQYFPERSPTASIMIAGTWYHCPSDTTEALLTVGAMARAARAQVWIYYDSGDHFITHMQSFG